MTIKVTKKHFPSRDLPRLLIAHFSVQETVEIVNVTIIVKG